jgi:hypothetical protein
MTDVPKVHYWHGKKIEDMSREELMAVVIEMGGIINDSWKYEKERHDAFTKELYEYARKLKEKAA